MTTIDRTAKADEVVLSDVLRFLWMWKTVVALGFGVGLLLSFPAIKLLPDTIGRTVTLVIYPSGTPTDTGADIQNQLMVLLQRNSFSPIPARTGLNLTVPMTYSAAEAANADGKFVVFAKVVADYRTALLAKVSGAYADLEQHGTIGQDPEVLVKFRSFREGLASGLIDPIRTSVVEHDQRQSRFLLTIIGLPVLGALIGALVAWAMAWFRSGPDVAD